MINLKKISFSGYKSFKNEVSLDNIKNVNLLIGKNNSGKSSVLDVIDYIFSKDNKKKIKIGNIKITQTLLEEIYKNYFRKDVHLGIGFSNGPSIYNLGIKLLNKDIEYNFEKTGGLNSKDIKVIDKNYDNFNHIEGNINGSANQLFNSLQFKEPLWVAAERNIIPELQLDNHLKKNVELEPNGNNATNIIASYLNDANKSEKLIEDKLLKDFNSILDDDAHFDRIMVQQIDGDKWEIYLVENDNRYPISEMGSGLKTILLVLLNLIVCNDEKKSNIFLFEELENNLHPALQRRLFNYIYNYAIDNNSLVFITSHSHVAVNCFYDKRDASIYHIEKNDGISSIRRVDNTMEYSLILNDLDVRASDLLQSNGIIWVEGPSDRVYIKKWISLIDKTIEENVDYQFAFYGGRLLSHYTADSDNKDKDLIRVLLTNRNSAIIMDSDIKDSSADINNTKKRIKEEFEKQNLFAWITAGKEIENYISSKVINKHFNSDYKQIRKYKLFPNYIKDSYKDFEKKKVLFSNEIINDFTIDSLNVLDLKEQIIKLVAEIKRWNHK